MKSRREQPKCVLTRYFCTLWISLYMVYLIDAG